MRHALGSLCRLAACAAATALRRSRRCGLRQAAGQFDCLACRRCRGGQGQQRSVAMLADRFGASVHGQAGIPVWIARGPGEPPSFPTPRSSRQSRAPRAMTGGCPLRRGVRASQARRRRAWLRPAGLSAPTKYEPSRIPTRRLTLNLPPAGAATATRRSARADRHRQRRGAVPGQHPRAGPVQEQPAVAQLRRLPQGATSGARPTPRARCSAHDPATCGRCHEGVQRAYLSGCWRRGGKERPDAVCVSCHSARRSADRGAMWKTQVLATGSCHPESKRVS
jgi:hypothetical protein